MPATLVDMDTMQSTHALADVLIAQPATAAAEHVAALQLYGQFVGSWDVELADHLPDGTDRRGRGEWHFGWVLEGRAIQDVWISPPRADRPAALETAYKNRFGTTIRVYDAAKKIWHITWNNPPSGDHVDLIARADGAVNASDAEIVQEGEMPDGTRKRWSFRDITRDSFRWVGEASSDGGRSWHTEQEMWARRVSASRP